MIITTACADSRSAVTTVRESDRVLHANAMNPRNVRPDSTHSRGRDGASAASAASTTFDASARTRIPFSAKPRYDASYHSGTWAKSGLSASGDPLTRQWRATPPPLAPSTSATVDMRCNAEAKW